MRGELRCRGGRRCLKWSRLTTKVLNLFFVLLGGRKNHVEKVCVSQKHCEIGGQDPCKCLRAYSHLGPSW